LSWSVNSLIPQDLSNLSSSHIYSPPASPYVMNADQSSHPLGCAWDAK
jgi:hypothetical protein